MAPLDARDLARWTGGQWTAAVPERLAAVCTDTRALEPGSLFVALRGERTDGHGFVAEAFRRGAAGAVVSASCGPLGALPPRAPLLRVGDTRRALQAMAAAYRRRLHAAVLGVTGSVGKTTVKEMAADVLARRLPTARSRGNWNNDIGLPLSVLAMPPDSRVGVFELGVSHPGDMDALLPILRPDWGLVTNIAPVHLEFFGSLAAIVREKARLIEALPAGGIALLNRDDPYADALRERAPCRVVCVGSSAPADYEARAAPDPAATVITERATGEQVSIRIPLPGAHQVANALMAVAAGRLLGVGWEDIRSALEAFRAQPMRWQQSVVAGVTVVNDAYNANPVSMAAALRAFAGLPVTGRRWLVLAGMLELGGAEAAAHRELGAALPGGPWSGLITVGPLGAAIGRAAMDAGWDPGRVCACADHAAAARALAERARPGDAVLLKASRGQHLETVLDLWRSASDAGPGEAPG